MNSFSKFKGWGKNNNLQLGFSESSAIYNSPKIIPGQTTGGIFFGKTIVMVSAGNFFALALDSGGTIYSWGENKEGQLGFKI